jgi:hypothetical protein
MINDEIKKKLKKSQKQCRRKQSIAILGWVCTKELGTWA